MGTSASARSDHGQRGHAAAIRSGRPAGDVQAAFTPRGADAVAQQRELQGRAAAVGDARGPEGAGVGDALVDEQAEQVLDVAHLVALVGEVDLSARAVGRARVRHPHERPNPRADGSTTAYPARASSMAL